MKKPGLSPIWIALIALVLAVGVVAMNVYKEKNAPIAVEQEGHEDHGH